MTEPDRRGRWWPWAVAALLFLMVSMMAILFWAAASDPTHVVEENYYQKAIDWDAATARQEFSTQLGWQVRLEFHDVPGEMSAAADAAKPNTLVLVMLTDSTGRPVTDVQVHLRAFFSARADRVFAADLQPVMGGYGAAFRLGPPGIWEFQVTALRDSTVFTWRGTRELGAMSAAR